MFMKLSDRDAFGYPNKYRSVSEAGVAPIGVDANTLLLLHMDGTNGSTSFPDASQYDVSIAANGAAQVSTSNKKFGIGALSCDGTGDYLECTLPAIGTGDFTFEGWFYMTDSNDRSLFGYSDFFNNLYVYTDITSLRAFIIGGTTLQTSGNFPTDEWFHLAVVRTGTAVTMYENGQSIASGTSSVDLDDTTFRVGKGTWNDFIGEIDEFRVSDVARYTANFTPQTGSFG